MKSLLVALALGTVGCVPAGYINAENVSGLVDAVCDRHDAYVANDPTYATRPNGEQRRQSDLRSSDLLRRIKNEALAAKGK